MPQIEVPTSQRHGSAPAYRNHSLNLEINELPPPQPASSEGQQVATVHDFLSLCGRGSNSSAVINTTHAEGNNRSYLPGQHPAYAVVNGSLEYPSNLQANYRSQVVSSHLQQGISINKNWQQQPQAQPQQLVPLDVNRKQAKEHSEEDDDDDESLDHGNKESRNLKCETVQRVDAKIIDTKNLTPRSKHSATEQRRRSKINDRFQTLRKLLPNADQKRDKASFLQEVIEYIQMLHEKIRKYEGTEHDGNHEEKVKPATLNKNPLARNEMNAFYVPIASVEPLDSNGYVRSRMNSSCLLGEADSSKSTELNMGIQPLSKVAVCPASYDNKALVSRTPSLVSTHHPVIKEQGSAPAISMATQTFIKEGQTMFGDVLHQDSNRAKSSPYGTAEGPGLSQPQLVRHTMAAQASSYGLNEDSEKLRSSECSLYTPNRPNVQEEEQGQDKHDRSWLSQGLDKHQVDVGSSSRGSRKDDGGKVDDSVRPNDGHGQEQRDEARGNEQPTVGGVINISSVYSQGLVDTLANALQSSGVDMSQATISVKIDLGNLGGSVMNSTRRDPGLSSPLHNVAVSSQESEQSRKRAKLEFDL